MIHNNINPGLYAQPEIIVGFLNRMIDIDKVYGPCDIDTSGSDYNNGRADAINNLELLNLYETILISLKSDYNDDNYEYWCGYNKAVEMALGMFEILNRNKY